MDIERELAELRRRVDELEAAAAMPGYSSLTGLQVAPDGSTSYDFDGHISADGVDLLAGTGGEPPEDRKVRWLDGEGGPPVASLAAWNDPVDVTMLQLSAHSDSNAAIARLEGELADHSAGYAYLEARARTAVTCDVLAVASDGGALQQRVVIDGQGESQFVQVHPSNGSRRIELFWSDAGGVLQAFVDGVYVGDVTA